MHIVAKWTGIPLKRMGQDETTRLLTVETEMEKIVVGQREGVSRAMQGVAPFARGSGKIPKAPDGTFLLLGPTGVGKTLLAKTLAEQMFGDAKSLIHLDMSEYMEKFENVSRLIRFCRPATSAMRKAASSRKKSGAIPDSVVLFR